jgi:hypothetical protein
MAFKDGELWFIQIQTDAWTAKHKYEDFTATHKINCMDINVKKAGSIDTRIFKYSGD